MEMLLHPADDGSTHRPHRRGRLQYALEAAAGERAEALTLPRIRARLRDLYDVTGERLKTLVEVYRQVPRPRR